MSDVDALLAAFESGELVRPTPSTPNVVDLANSIVQLTGSDGVSPSANAVDIAELVGPSDHLVFIIADGLGMNVVRAMDGSGFLREHVATELITVFPSSTPVVLTSYATGVWPSEHGVPGWYVYLDEIDVVATIIYYARRSDEVDLGKLGLDAAEAFSCPSVLDRIEWDTLGFIPKEIAGTAYSNYFHGRTPQKGYDSLEKAVDALIARIDRAAGPTFTYLYTPSVDTVTHEHGTEHPAVSEAVTRLEREVERLRGELPPTARIVMSADHGLLDSSEAEVHALAPSDDLISYLAKEPWGTERAVCFQVQPERADIFGDAFRSRFGDSFFLIDAEEAESIGLLGDGSLSPATRRRLGTHLAVSRGSPALEYEYPRNKKNEHPTIGRHSGLSPEEMTVPLVIA